MASLGGILRQYKPNSFIPYIISPKSDEIRPIKEDCKIQYTSLFREKQLKVNHGDIIRF